jgi:IS5 family transposase
LLLVEAIPPVGGRRGRPKRRPQCLVADRGYDQELYRRQLRALGVTPLIARRKTEHGSGLGSWRWVVERTFAWLHQFHRLQVRYERSEQTHQALLDLACCLICFKRLQHFVLGALRQSRTLEKSGVGA